MCAIGIVFSVLFHIFVKEPEYVPKPRKVRPSVFTVETKKLLQHSRGSTTTMTLLAQNQPDTDCSGRPSISNAPDSNHQDIEKVIKSRLPQKKWSTWFKSFNFWKITIMYTMARMFVNLSQVYTPLYLQYTLEMPKVCHNLVFIWNWHTIWYQIYGIYQRFSLMNCGIRSFTWKSDRIWFIIVH